MFFVNYFVLPRPALPITFPSVLIFPCQIDKKSIWLLSSPTFISHFASCYVSSFALFLDMHFEVTLFLSFAFPLTCLLSYFLLQLFAWHFFPSLYFLHYLLSSLSPYLFFSLALFPSFCLLFCYLSCFYMPSSLPCLLLRSPPWFIYYLLTFSLLIRCGSFSLGFPFFLASLLSLFYQTCAGLIIKLWLLKHF